MRPWRTLSSKKVLENPWFSVRADRCETPEGKIVDPFYVVDTFDWAHVVALTPDRQLLLVRQFRYGANQVVDELPGGICDSREDALATAQRELREETGAVSDNWIQVACVHPDPARQSNRVWTFLATDIRFEYRPKFDGHEELEHRLAPLDEVPRLIADGRFTQSTQIAGYFLARELLTRRS